MTYFKTKELNIIIRHAWVLFVVLLLLFFLLRYVGSKQNLKVIYENLDTVVEGEDIKVALKKMKRGTILLQYSNEECLDCYDLLEKCPDCDSRKDIYVVTFYVMSDNRLNYYAYPKIYYNRKTNKVLMTDAGRVLW